MKTSPFSMDVAAFPYTPRSSPLITKLEPVAIIRHSNRASQEKQINEACAKLGLIKPVRLYNENRFAHAGSGDRKKMADPLEKLLDAARTGYIAPYSCVLIVESIARFSRTNINSFLETVLELLRNGVSFYSLECDLLMLPADKNDPAKRVALLFEIQRASEYSERMSRLAKQRSIARKSLDHGWT